MVLLIIIYLAFISLGLPDSMFGAAWPSMHLSFGVKIGDIGYLVLFSSCCTVLSSLFSVKIINKAGTPKVLVASTILTASAIVSVSFAQEFWHMFIICVPLGLGAGCVDAALNGVVAKHFKARHMNWLHCFWGVGASVGPLILAARLSFGGTWRDGFLIVGIVQCCMIAVMFFSQRLFKKLEKKDVVKQQDPENTQQVSLLRALRIKGVKITLLVFVLYISIEVIIGAYISTYSRQVLNVSQSFAALIASFFYWGITIGRFASGILSGKVKGQHLIKGGIILCICAVTVAIFVKNPVLSAVVFCVAGVGLAPIYPSLLHLTPSRFKKENAQVIMGLSMATGYSSCIVVPPLFSLLATALGFNILPLVAAIIAVFIFALTELLNIRDRYVPSLQNI